MGITASTRKGWYRCEVVDIQAELSHWKDEIEQQPFHEPGTPFARYEPVLRFAYDAYLRHHAQPLEEVLESIHHKYVEQFDPWRGVPWARVEPLIREVWMRMGAPTNGIRNNAGQVPNANTYLH